VYLLLPPVLHLILLCRVVNSKDEEVELHSSVECKVLMQQLFSTSHYVATMGINGWEETAGISVSFDKLQYEQ